AADAYPPEEAPAARGRTSEEDTSPPAPAAEERRETATGAGVQRKGSKKTRRPAPRRKKQPQAETDWGRLVLVAALVLLGVAVLVLVSAAIYHFTNAQAAAGKDPTPSRTARAARFEHNPPRPALSPRPQLTGVGRPRGGLSRGSDGPLRAGLPARTA